MFMELVTETGLFPDLIMIFTGVLIYSLIKEDNEKRRK